MWKWGARWEGRQLGPIRVALLLALRRKPMYGYELIKALQAQFAGIWEPKTGTVYPALRSLRAQGLVVTHRHEAKEHYRLTAVGETVLHQLGETMETGVDFATRYLTFMQSCFLSSRHRWTHALATTDAPRRGRDAERQRLLHWKATLKARLDAVEEQLRALEDL